MPPKVSRLNALLQFDRKIIKSRERACYLIGLDEVGRGSLIGPVVAGAVCLPNPLTRSQRELLKWLDDSKKLSQPIRAELAEAIHSFCQVGIGQAEKEEVDQLNVHYASLLAVHRAFLALCTAHGYSCEQPDLHLLIDGRALIPDLNQDCQQAVIKGDGKSAAIAAASVIAKEARDSMIRKLAKQYPGYGWEENMGYGTPAHLQGIQRLGITPLHRKNYRQVAEQLTLSLS